MYLVEICDNAMRLLLSDNAVLKGMLYIAVLKGYCAPVVIKTASSCMYSKIRLCAHDVCFLIRSSAVTVMKVTIQISIALEIFVPYGSLIVTEVTERLIYMDENLFCQTFRKCYSYSILVNVCCAWRSFFFKFASY